MVVHMTVNGKMIECKVMVNFYIPTAKLHMKVIGYKMSLMEWAVSSINFLKILIGMSA
jgi:hypothetical protein